ncbi:ParB/RepB/Spo0J family partition protein [Nocardioides alkalitolerans]|uniref:ParB/RepB/Spo0J family partition protein n=1 Tax=Nocardioides alkalitolerans TaxID=281714 RepID=UPI0004114995|nr:ParB/RepB/Spo0J family partition protein [Nocardioides alkalitolerans]
MTTTVRTIPLRELSAHPKNPRHQAVADDELVVSIKQHGLVQPLVVAPAADGADGFVIIAGHRRHAAAKKARLKDLPCIVREDLDTDATQVMAMYLENSSRVDLTPIEEAETYQALIDLGLKQKDIAQKTGRAAKTVSTRLRLLRLQKSTQKKVHEGQVTIEDSLALVEFADDPEATAKLEKAAGTYNFQYELARARQAREVAAQIATDVAALEQEGVPNVGDLPTDFNAYGSFVREAGLTAISRDAVADHAGHVKYGVRGPGYLGDVARLIIYCADQSAHVAADQDPAAIAAEAARRESEEEAAAADRAHAEMKTAARKVRLDTATETATAHVAKGGPAVIEFIRAALPSLIELYVERYGHETYVQRLDLPGETWDMWSGPGLQSWRDHFADLREASPARVARIFTEVLALAPDGELDAEGYSGAEPDLTHMLLAPWLDYLESVGHEWHEVEVPYIDAVRRADEAETEGDEADAEAVPA